MLFLQIRNTIDFLIPKHVLVIGYQQLSFLAVTLTHRTESSLLVKTNNIFSNLSDVFSEVPQGRLKYTRVI